MRDIKEVVIFLGGEVYSSYKVGQRPLGKKHSLYLDDVSQIIEEIDKETNSRAINIYLKGEMYKKYCNLSYELRYFS